MKYFMLNFSCYSEKPMEDVYSEGGKRITAIAKEAGIETRHAYSWPDGSLYIYAKVQTEDQLKVFDDTSELPGNSILCIRFQATEEDALKIREHNLTSLQELYTKTPTEIHALYMARNDELEKLMQPYDKHREECPRCPKPTGLCCEDGLVVLRECQAAKTTCVDQMISS